MTGTPAGTVPWRDSDVVMVAATAVIGMATIGTAWFAASGTTAVATQAGWLNLAVAGFAISAVGCCLWLLRLRRAVGERRAGLVSLDTGGAAAAADPHEPARASSTAALTLVRAAGMSRVHYPDCPLVAGKQLEAATVGDGQPCSVCGP